MGKYVRHLLAVLLGFFFGAITAWLKAEWGYSVPEDQVATLVDALVSLLEPGVMVGVYAVTEKYLKRFAWLDLEGWIDRLWLREEKKEIEAEEGVDEEEYEP